jgi:hypothetical protein
MEENKSGAFHQEGDIWENMKSKINLKDLIPVDKQLDAHFLL